jgi:hypothetical protein
LRSSAIPPRAAPRPAGRVPPPNRPAAGVAIIVAIFFWGTALGGILGMVLAIPLTAFFVTAWRLLKHKYLPALAGTHA